MPAIPGAPRWAAPASLVVCGLGLADSAYLAYEHYTASATLACSESGTVNCLKVTTSPQSVMFGVPLPVFGLLFFVVMTVLCLPVMWRVGPAVSRIRMVGSVIGVLSVLYLVYVELFQVGAICLYCTGVHILTILLFFIVLFASALAPGAHPSEMPRGSAAEERQR